MSQDAAAADPSSSEAVEELLRQLVDARFVLTDRDGAVTRWSRPAEVLFGWPAEGMVGRPLVKTLGLPDNLPESGGQLTAMVRCQDGEELEVAMGLVPVRMSHSLEFNGFLEALEIVAPRGDALSALGRSHRTVVDWIQTALNGEAELDDDGLAAGTIIAFRPLHEPPPEPTLEELELAAVEADLEEAALAQERLASLEQAGAGLESELADTRRALDEMRAQLESLHGHVEHTLGARDEQAQADGERSSATPRRPSERERLRRELDEMRTAVEGFRRDAAGAPQAQERLRAQLDQTREELKALEAARCSGSGLSVRIDEVHGRLAGFESALSEAARAETIEETTRSLRSELAEAQARVEELEAEGASERTRVEEELGGTRARLEHLEAERTASQSSWKPSSPRRATASMISPAPVPRSRTEPARRPRRTPRANASVSRASSGRRARTSSAWRARATRSVSSSRESLPPRAPGSTSWPPRGSRSWSTSPPRSPRRASTSGSRNGRATTCTASWKRSSRRRPSARHAGASAQAGLATGLTKPARRSRPSALASRRRRSRPWATRRRAC